MYHKTIKIYSKGIGYMQIIFGFILGVASATLFFKNTKSKAKVLCCEYCSDRPYYMALDENKKPVGFLELSSDAEVKKSVMIREWQASGYEVVTCTKEELSARMHEF